MRNVEIHCYEDVFEKVNRRGKLFSSPFQNCLHCNKFWHFKFYKIEPSILFHCQPQNSKRKKKLIKMSKASKSDVKDYLFIAFTNFLSDWKFPKKMPRRIFHIRVFSVTCEFVAKWKMLWSMKESYRMVYGII